MQNQEETSSSQLVGGISTSSSKPIYPSSRPLFKLPRCTEPADKQKIGFLSLPGEIRNQIMLLAIGPGDVYLLPKDCDLLPGYLWKQYLTDTSGCVPWESDGFHIFPKERRRLAGLPLAMLATCQQVYLEARHVPYAKNTFHLAPGSLSHTTSRIQMISPQDFNMISTLCLDLSMADLDPVTMESILLGHERYSKSRTDDEIYLDGPQRVMGALQTTWIAKLQYIRKMKNLAEVRIRITIPDPPYRLNCDSESYDTFCDELIIEGGDVSRALRRFAPQALSRRHHRLPQLSGHGLDVDWETGARDDRYNHEVKKMLKVALRKVMMLLMRYYHDEGSLHGFDPWSPDYIGNCCVGKCCVKGCYRSNDCKRGKQLRDVVVKTWGTGFRPSYGDFVGFIDL